MRVVGVWNLNGMDGIINLYIICLIPYFKLARDETGYSQNCSFYNQENEGDLKI